MVRGNLHNNWPVLCLDGPGGVGKGTVGQIIAERLGWHFLDSGAIYRVLALVAKQKGIAPTDAENLLRLTNELRLEYESRPGDDPLVFVDGIEVSHEIRTEECGEFASKLATIPEVREGLISFQRRQCRAPGLVADGRDMGTVVFPNAETKIFLTATAKVRAQRRYNQLNQKGLGGNLPRLIRVIQERDERDSTRAVSPLIPSDDAHILDTSDLTIHEVVEHILGLLAATRN